MRYAGAMRAKLLFCLFLVACNGDGGKSAGTGGKGGSAGSLTRPHEQAGQFHMGRPAELANRAHFLERVAPSNQQLCIA